MKTAHNSHRGQALVIFVFALIGLIGMTGLAIDSGMVFSDRRHAQNAADTAALAGALVKIDGHKASHWTNADCLTAGSGPCKTAVVRAALDRAASNGYTSNIVDNTVQVNIPPVSGPYSDCNNYSFNCEDYIQVIIDSNVNTFFAKVLGILQMHNQVEAVVLAKYAPASRLYGGNSLVQLKPTSSGCNGDLVLGGSGSVTLNGGGLFVNSDNPTCAFKETSSCIQLIMNNASLWGIGGSFTSSCTNAPTMTHVTEQYLFPPELDLPEPAECHQSPQTPVTSGGVTTYYPGYYDPVHFPPDRDAILSPGIYCVDTVVKTTNTYTMTGDNVLIYIKDGGFFDFSGGTVRLSGLSTPANSPYKGYLIYVDSDYIPWGDENCTINGGADDTFIGVIYAPNCNVTINGGGSPTGITAQLIAYTIQLNGSANLIFNYDQNLMPGVPEVKDMGLFR